MDTSITKQKTHQEIFTASATHLLKQMERSSIFGFTCAYRNGVGLSCAVGCLIPDETYTADLEGNHCLEPGIVNVLAGLGLCYVGDLLTSGMANEPVEGSRLHLMRRLQMVHDSVKPEDWRGHLEGLAVQFGLDMPVMP